MRIEHLALWARDIEALKEFYIRWFGAESGASYANSKTGFRSYFLSFASGPRLELMNMPGIAEGGGVGPQRFGLIHFAIQAESRDEVLRLTEEMRAAGVVIASEPRLTGDGYFESCVFDPEGNRIEITA